MKQRIQFVAGLILCLPVVCTMAAAPRFTGVGDALDASSATDVTSDASTSTNTTKPKQAAADESKTTAVSTQAEKSTAPPSKLASADTSHAEAASGKPAHSWLYRLFHKQTSNNAQALTRKQDDALVNTDKRHEDVYDLLQTADVHRFQPGYDGRWRVQASNVMCRLRQQLPSYGYVEFRQGVAQPLEFALYVDHPPAGSGIVQVSSEPPLWRHYTKAKDLGTLDLDDGDRAVTASATWARRLLIELSEGMQPVLHFWDAADASEDIEIFLSALQFQKSLDQFYQCLGQLLKYDFKQVQLNVVHFNPDSSKLRKQAYQQLDEVLETAKLDKGISEINLEIYTYRDGLERYNFRLATRRAQGVRDYLLKHGIKEDRIFIKIYTKNKEQMHKLGYSDADVYIALQRKKQK